MERKIDLLEEYDDKKHNYQSLCDKISPLIHDLLKANKIIVHHLSSRTKERAKLKEKISRKGFKYKSIDEITDIAGIRIITYFAEDVDRVADIINSEFKVDPENTIDKRNLDEDKFGYLSMHYVVSLTDERLQLTEYKKYSNLKFEIQIRSILQHGWAEIEHDLGYKGAKGIPSQFKRDFNRIAALLETADNEFDRLKRELDNYNLQVEKDFNLNSSEMLINNSTLRQFLEQDKTLNIINLEIAKYYNVELNNNPENPDLGDLSEKLKSANITTIKDLKNLVETQKKDFLISVNEILSNKSFNGTITGVNYMVGVYEILDFIKYSS